MANLETTYLGLKLKSPVIAGSSSITSSLSRLRELEAAGAGAVVLKSLFEEQINYVIAATPGLSDYPESDDYIAAYTRSNAVSEYLELIAEAKKNLKIPVIASINCITSDSWVDFASKIESAGADAIEVNVYFLPVNRKTPSSETEKLYFSVVENLKKRVKIPVAVKIGQGFSNVLWFVDQLYNRGVEGVVMFNRFYEPDIDIETMELVSSPVFSNPGDRRYVLRWVALASGMGIKTDISASTGVHSSDDAIRYLLAGATTVQVCSALYEKGVSFVSDLNKGIEVWMEKNKYSKPGDFRGKLGYGNIENPSRFERSQFIKYFSSYH